MTLPAFYPVLPDANWIARLVPVGVKLVQLRLKDAKPDEIRRQISACLKVCVDHDCQLIVNDYWREAIELGADYIHLGQEDLAAANLDDGVPERQAAVQEVVHLLIEVLARGMS